MNKLDRLIKAGYCVAVESIPYVGKGFQMLHQMESERKFDLIETVLAKGENKLDSIIATINSIETRAGNLESTIRTLKQFDENNALVMLPKIFHEDESFRVFCKRPNEFGGFREPLSSARNHDNHFSFLLDDVSGGKWIYHMPLQTFGLILENKGFKNAGIDKKIAGYSNDLHTYWVASKNESGGLFEESPSQTFRDFGFRVSVSPSDDFNPDYSYMNRVIENLSGNENVDVSEINNEGILQDFSNRKRITGILSFNYQAVNDFRKKAEVDKDEYSQFMLGLVYEHGTKEVEKDIVQAERWYRKSAEKGFHRAQFALGYLYHIGEVVQKDYIHAASYYRKSAEQGFPLAQLALARMYIEGDGVKQDFKKAFSWAKLSAEEGEPDAQSLIGFSYHRGLGVAKDQSQAKLWLHKAANQEHAEAQFGLSALYFAGLGVSQNIPKGLWWMCKSAKQGHQDAVKMIDGIGASIDAIEGLLEKGLPKDIEEKMSKVLKKELENKLK